ncbi:2-amino-3,7-dideoxy-D-threo-hept-6-ulosonate synthase [Actinokineospora globicatena]|uniref:2-amino-3,7-dideoxy-D-threo-hept-6-ulosonate synthase n=1 Tax=Actinokineospora globicatena TaxID=103729 RepID=UPI0020A2B900|nr:2-amino-3,7-dideoxy-D-threo-hept-6-ulosonate synthase [Actinokineospora globicatena]MCP2306758.1 2-amino-3,7-dideoxy-D-threo-hept-6-ulosonate synthase [Actinokineospora globicatena]GLW82123.1 fructose-bisphosphate aldolase [Actinokineospora globicatena]GLW88916.1 fructose-bisphosphate aldolase [Actinokineospora globicatena]
MAALTPTPALTGKALRLARLSRPNDGRFLFVPLDHSVSDGPIGTAADFAGLVGEIVAGGADAVVVHKGRARMIPVDLLAGCGLVVHLSASTAQAPDADAKVLVGDVAEAVRLGADAVSVHVNIGSDTEAAQLADLGTVAAECDRWGMPLMAMVYPRGPRVADPSVPDLLAHAAGVAADLGADLVKTVMARPAERMADVVASCPLPIVVAGGAGEQDAARLAAAVMSTGCAGLAVGRRVFTSPTPRRTVRELAAAVHGGVFPPRQSEADPRNRLAEVL